MSKLLLLRHGKAESHETGIKDHERRLTTRGEEDAALMGRYLASRGLVPDVMLYSDSRRTRQTADALLHACEGSSTSVEQFSLRELYLADPETILGAVDLYGSRGVTVLVVGHNPGLEQVATTAAGAHVRLRTADLAIINVDGEGRLSFERLIPRGSA